mgnify:CR=1 FL=1
MNHRERFCVNFRAEISTADNCICNACHHIGWVIKLDLPETVYNNGGKLKTKYRPFWLCKNCRDKLVNALDWRTDNA